METNDSINIIKQARLAAGYTQLQINDLLGIPCNTQTQWETGRRNPPEYVLKMYLLLLQHPEMLERTN